MLDFAMNVAERAGQMLLAEKFIEQFRPKEIGERSVD